MANLAKSEDVAVLALHQLNRGVEGRDNKRPQLADLRDSGNLEQDADGVWLLYRPAYYLERAKDDEGSDGEALRRAAARGQEHILEIAIAKQRNGETGTVDAVLRHGLQRHPRPRQEAHMNTNVDFTAGALPYAEQLGWKVLLLAPGSKLPFVSKEDGGNGVHDATSDPDQIRAWGKLCPNGNIGIACGEASGIVVVDVDPRNGGDVSIRALAAKGHPFPQAPRQRTGNGGFHLALSPPGRHRQQQGQARARHRCEVDRRLHRRRAVVDQAVRQRTGWRLRVGGLAVRRAAPAHADLDGGDPVSATSAEARVRAGLQRRRRRAARALRRCFKHGCSETIGSTGRPAAPARWPVEAWSPRNRRGAALWLPPQPPATAGPRSCARSIAASVKAGRCFDD